MASVPKPKHDGSLPERLFQVMVRMHIFFYRLTGGVIGNKMSGVPCLLLTTTGRKSGQKRTIPLMYVETDQGYAIIASYAGSDRHPAWYLNLTANPQVEVQVRAKKMSARAETVPDGNRYSDIWQRAAGTYADYNLYKERTDRQIPIVELVPFSDVGTRAA